MIKEKDNQGWINVNDRLPPKEKYVLIHLKKDNWRDNRDPEGVYFQVGMLVIGISKEEREALKSSTVEADLKRAKTYRIGDEWFNNLRPYCWETFGPSKYFGQEVDFWMEMPPLNTPIDVTMRDTLNVLALTQSLGNIPDNQFSG